MSEYYWWRRLVGGIWVVNFGQWKRVLPEHYITAERLMSCKWITIEDHRYFRSKP